MDRKELLLALEDIEARLDIGNIDDDEYTYFRDAVDKLKYKLSRRLL